VLSALGIITKVRNRVKFIGFRYLSKMAKTDIRALEVSVNKNFPVED
jgi:hypothetical protein